MMLQNLLRNELDSEVGLVRRYRCRKAILDGLERRKRVLIKPSLELLRQEYGALQRALNRRFPECAVRTPAEQVISNAIGRVTNLQFFKSLWIVNRNVDLFCPAVGQLHSPIVKGEKIVRKPIMRGWVIEVDGSIHNYELKMRKDSAKIDLLATLGISVSTIENHDLERSIRRLIEYLQQLPRLDSRARNRLWGKIYTATLAYHADNKVMARLYGDKFLELKINPIN